MNYMGEQVRSQPPKGGARDDVHVRAWRSMLELRLRLMAIFEAELEAELDVDLTTYDALLHVYEAGPDGIRMTDLSGRLVVSKSGVTALVDRLEGRGLLERVPDPKDRRAIRVAITEEGTRVFRAAAKVHLAGIEHHFTSHVTEDEARTILEVMERISHAEEIGRSRRPT